MAPMSGRAKSTTPKATDTRPPTMNIARVPAVSPLRKPAANSMMPVTIAQLPTSSTRTRRRGTRPGEGDDAGGDVDESDEQVPDHGLRPGAAERERQLRDGLDEGVDGEHDDQRQHGDAGPGESHRTDGKREQTSRDQGIADRFEHDMSLSEGVSRSTCWTS